MTGVRWRRGELGDVAVIERESVAPNAIVEGEAFVGLQNIDGATGSVDARAVRAGEIASTKFRFGPQHVLYGKLRPNLRKVGRTDTSGICSTDILPILPGPELDRDYLFHFLRQPSLVSLAVMRTPSANLPRLSPRILRGFPIRYPPLPEQRRIAAILDKADAVCRKRQQTLDLADQFLRSAFLDMFGDPVTNSKGWEILPLEQLCTRITDGTHQPPDWSEQGLPFLFVSNIVNGRITFQTKKHISEETWKELTRRCPIEVNDILYTTVGSYGNAALVNTDRRFAFQRHIAHIKPDGNRIHPEFLVGMLQSPVVHRQADHAVRGIAQKTLNLGDLKKFRVFLPPRDEQERFLKLRRSALHQGKSAENAVAGASNLLDSLIQRAFRGESWCRA